MIEIALLNLFKEDPDSPVTQTPYGLINSFEDNFDQTANIKRFIEKILDLIES